MANNTKLVKSLKAAYDANSEALKSVSAEIEKIDEKYRQLAEKEKKSLSKTVDILTKQVEQYKTLLSQFEEPEADKVEDNIYPENNEPECPEATEEATRPEEDDDFHIIGEVESEPDNELENEIEVESTDEFSFDEPEEKQSEESTDDNDGWPAMPQEWN